MSLAEPTIQVEVVAERARVAARIWHRLEERLTRLGERLNPILVKEARQALKSKQFTITFTLVLICCWTWSILGLALLGPDVHYLESAGREMFYGYYLILALPLLVIVPYSAFRSLASEREDNTYELLSIATLSARQIISGKLASAMLQMLVYLSAVAPCLTFTYLLRGMDILTIAGIVIYTVLASMGASLVGLLVATSSSQRYRQVVMSVLFVVALVVLMSIASMMAATMLSGIAIPFDSREFWIFNAALLTAYGTSWALFFLAAAAQLNFASSNRSTGLRVAALIQFLALLAWTGGIWLSSSSPDLEVLVVFIWLAGLQWYVIGIFMTGEPSRLSPRVMRDLPQSFLGRALLTWFNPGPGTGYVFAVCNMLAALAITLAGLALAPILKGTSTPLWAKADVTLSFAVVSTCYLVIYLGIGRLLLGLAERVAPVSPVLRLLLHLLLVLLGTGVPLVIQLSMDSLRLMGYSLLQITNPFWTLEAVLMPGMADQAALLILLPLAAVCVFAANLPAVVREVRHVRIAKPTRVAEEDAALVPEPVTPPPTSPWG